MEETKEFFEKNFKATAERDLIDTILFYLHECSFYAFTSWQFFIIINNLFLI